ncbi:helix-turn-helix domain-containing protein [Anoxynatronum buryatiense]|uniref:Helix-turn-helix n=1 Tax=Anoxynatronum buryatiense TaxID=489973 RepID=A0AA45WT98_9CLOT|nr:helix-turn-helix transcriptional regulator [Anoxynatronum buryatiense]SMP38341.1 Helix-turn-helix [Anoxynatronum buryatiense]
MNFEKAVKEALIDKRMTQSALAKQLGISGPYLSDIIRGNRIAQQHRERIIVSLGLQGNVEPHENA